MIGSPATSTSYLGCCLSTSYLARGFSTGLDRRHSRRSWRTYRLRIVSSCTEKHVSLRLAGPSGTCRYRADQGVPEYQRPPATYAGSGMLTGVPSRRGMTPYLAPSG